MKPDRHADVSHSWVSALAEALSIPVLGDAEVPTPTTALRPPNRFAPDRPDDAGRLATAGAQPAADARSPALAL